MLRACAVWVLGLTAVGGAWGQSGAAKAPAVEAARAPVGQVSTTKDGPTRDDLLRGGYGHFRANNDLLFYHLDVRVDPEQKSIAG